MLLELVVSNVVIVERARLTPGEGLTVISGETGAGKSLMLDALLLLLGGRAQGKIIGPHRQEAVVTGVFHVESDLAQAIERATGVAAQDGQFIMRRRLSAGGRSQSWINDIPVTLAAVQKAAEFLVVVHAQNEALRLGAIERQLELLDAYGNHSALADSYRAAHVACLALHQELTAIESGERDSLKELDFLRYQAQEFDALAPKAGDLARLEQRYELLAGAETWRQRAEHACDLLSERDHSVLRSLASVMKSLHGAPNDQLQQAHHALQQAQEFIRDAVAHAQQALDVIQSDPAALAALEEKRSAWYEIMRKHGDNEAAVLSAWDAITQRIRAIEGLDARRAELQDAVQQAQHKRAQLGSELQEKRRQSFKKLSKAVLKELSELGMPKAQLDLRETVLAEAGPHGTLLQEIVVATNPGLPAERLGMVTSGGEASRLSLAFAVVLAQQDRTPVLIFDEVDAGVGGRLGTVIGTKLARIAHQRSVLAITHTPQVAASAARHYCVRKQQFTERTDVVVQEITGEQRLVEIADMLGGGAAALSQAKTLLENPA
jgi:DNA repair protein RecN (Recombination protein N)